MAASSLNNPVPEALTRLAEIPPAGSEERKAWLARAEQAGAILYNDRTRTLLAAEGAILALMSAARRQGQRDVLEATSFQKRNAAWMAVAFAGDPTDLPERVARFGEESLELQQALGQTREDAHRLVDYVYDRPIGRADKEMGGTLTTLACLAVATGLDMATCGEDELARVSSTEFIAKLRGKRATRHGRGPLPGFSAPGTSEPLKPGDPIPEPGIYRDAPETGGDR